MSLPKPGGWVSKSLFDEVIRDRLDTWSTKLIMGLGVTADVYQIQIAGLASLAHVVGLIAQALAITLTFYAITRWI